ncbi:MAG: hypothetical protein A2W91_03390 [Bacteroidetes bacterium GWF2_38_335]|nr:MAG: hypothetical protein A2W91_03390 [Bacteroidetes bacterium GWF2_38_335]OFY77470.1 MAG: hypothetical protein A2281_01370 [Bacteroidetes bacterium RIFOXYA12_FULL_38_20]HBS87238.1 hypothetical protein [Bacteroidales bacterium]
MVLIFNSCKEKDNTDFPAIDYSYFPVDTGKWAVYQVEEITIDSAISLYDTVRYQIKEVYESYFPDNENRRTVRIERFIREEAGDPWEMKDVWAANLIPSSAQIVEENYRYMKIAFPANINETWNGNLYNIFDPETYEITSIDEPYSINGLNFDSVLTVTQLLDSTLIYKYHKEEKYAKNIGLISKIDLNIESQNIAYPWVPVEDRPTQATIYRQKIIDYGWE